MRHLRRSGRSRRSRPGGPGRWCARSVLGELEEHRLEVGADRGQLADVDLPLGQDPGDVLGPVGALDQQPVAVAGDPEPGGLEDPLRGRGVRDPDPHLLDALLADEVLDRAGGEQPARCR